MKSKKIQLILLSIVLLFPFVTLAQFQPLIGIPGLTDAELNFNTYINTLYTLSISIAGLLAVIKIIIAGVKYMLSDVVSSKQSAIGDIKGALLGLLIVLAAFVILNTINPELTRSRLFLDPVTQATGGGSGGGGGTATPAPQKVTISTEVCDATDCMSAIERCTIKGGTAEAFVALNGQIIRTRMNCFKMTP